MLTQNCPSACSSALSPVCERKRGLAQTRVLTAKRTSRGNVVRQKTPTRNSANEENGDRKSSNSPISLKMLRRCALAYVGAGAVASGTRSLGLELGLGDSGGGGGGFDAGGYFSGGDGHHNFFWRTLPAYARDDDAQSHEANQESTKDLEGGSGRRSSSKRHDDSAMYDAVDDDGDDDDGDDYCDDIDHDGDIYEEDDAEDVGAAGQGGKTSGKMKKSRSKDSFTCESVLATNLPTGPGIPTKSELFQGLNARRGAELSKKDLSDDLDQLLNTGLFANVDANVTPKKDGYAVEFIFREKIWPRVQTFRVAGATALPKHVELQVLEAAQKSQNCTVRVLATAKNIIESYYTSKGLTFGTISHFDGMENGEVIAHIVEGEISRVQTVYLDENMQVTNGNRGFTHPRVIQREHSFKVGKLYNVEDAKTALRDIFLLQLFDNVQVVPRPDEKDPTKVQVDIMLRERPVRTAETELEWSIAPGEQGRPDLVSARPGGSVFVEQRNLDGWGRQLFGSVSTANFFQPQDDLGFKLEYIHPYCFGDDDELKSSFKTAVFNTRKLSPTFTGGPLMDEVPGVWIDRAGLKATLSQHFTRQSHSSTSLVLEEITSRDDSGAICAHGAKQLSNGSLAADGPRTTHSESGTDRVLLLQNNSTRDTTKFVNGTQVGARDIFQFDQSVGLSAGLSIYNRLTAEVTRFIQLLSENKQTMLPPPILVMHSKLGHIIGNCSAYDAYTLGGPHSCRGYNVGELGVSRSVLESAIELRVPVPYLNTHAFLFWENCSDLNSSAKVMGNPTEYYRRAGRGTSFGCGLKLGPVRAEWCADGNQGSGSTYIRFGERF